MFSVGIEFTRENITLVKLMILENISALISNFISKIISLTYVMLTFVLACCP